MVRAEFLRRVGAVTALLGIGCLLVALILPWTHVEPLPGMEGVQSGDYSLLLFFLTPFPESYSLAPTVFILYLLPFLGSCLVVVEALRAWQGSAATRAGSARLLLLLLGMSCALFGLAAIPALVQVVLGIVTGGSVLPAWWVWVAEGPRFASAGFSAVVAGGVLLAVGALLHRWTLKRNASQASATTTG